MWHGWQKYYDFIDKTLTQEATTSTVPKKYFVKALLYLWKLSSNKKKNKSHNCIMKIKVPVGSQISVDSCLFSKTKCKISNTFTFKDSIRFFFRSGIINKFPFSGCKILPIMTKLNIIFISNIWALEPAPTPIFELTPTNRKLH